MTTSSIATKVTLSIRSPAFPNEGYIPQRYTCDGENINPPLEIDGIPHEAKSLVLIVEDPDAPGNIFDHWVVWNVRPQRHINENSVPGKVGKNSLGENRYMGPCPPSGTHRYFFKVYALDRMLEVNHDTDKKNVEQEIANHVLAYGEMMGLYKTLNPSSEDDVNEAEGT